MFGFGYISLQINLKQDVCDSIFLKLGRFFIYYTKGTLNNTDFQKVSIKVRLATRQATLTWKNILPGCHNTGYHFWLPKKIFSTD